MTGMESWTDREFINYCRSHAQTPRRLFSGYQINRLKRMAGETAFPIGDTVSWGHGDYGFIGPLCDKAEALLPKT
jgi:hypothetical protein